MSGCCGCVTNNCHQKYPPVFEMISYLFCPQVLLSGRGFQSFLSVNPQSNVLLIFSPGVLSFSPFRSSRHVRIHEEPATAPALFGSRLTQTPLQKPVCQTGSWRVIGWRGSERTQTPQQVCRRRKVLCNLGQLRSNAFLCPDWLVF